MNPKTIISYLVGVAFVIYVIGMAIILIESLTAIADKWNVHKNWILAVTLLTPVLALNAGAYIGVKPVGFFPDSSEPTPEQIRGYATVFYILIIVIAFFVSTISAHPHTIIQDMASTLLGLIAGVVAVFLGR